MGKSWFSIVKKAFASDAKDKKDHKSQKQKKRWFGKQTSSDSIAYTDDNASLIETSTVAAKSSPPLPPPPPVPAAAPQPRLPPPSPPPPPPPLPSTSTQPDFTENVSSDESREAHTRQALVFATAVAAEAAVMAANAAAEVVRLSSIARQTGKSKEEIAAIKIQTAYRGYMARRALQALRGMARLKLLVQGQYGKKQATAMLRSMQTLSRLQTQMQERKARITEENKARHRLLHQKQHQQEPNKAKTSIGDNFDVSMKSKEQIEARLQYRKEAAVRRERALAYAYSHQQTWRNSTKLPHQTLMDPNNLHWGWSWLERWMATRPWEAQTKTTYNNNNNDNNSDQASTGRDLANSSIKQKVVVKPKTRKSISQGAIQVPVKNRDSNKANTEKNNRRHSIAIGTPSVVKDDEESVCSSSSLRSSMVPKNVAKSRSVSVPKASNLGSEKKRNDVTEKNPVALTKKRLSSSDPPKITRRSSDTGKDMAGRNGGKQSSGSGGR